MEKRSKAVSLLHDALANPSKSWDLYFLADDVVLHKDDLSLDHDVKGIDPVQNYFKAFAQQFSSQTLLELAIDPEAHSAYSFFSAEGATLQAEASARAAEGTASQGPLAISHNASSVVGLAAFFFNDSDEIKDIYFTRQLTGDEIETKMKRTEGLSPQIDPKEFSSSSPPGHAASEEVLAVARKYSNLWNEGDVKQVLDLLADDCLEVDAVSGSRKEGKQPIMHMMDGVNKGWQVRENTSKEAATENAGSVFIYWASKDTSNTSLYGLSLLVMNSAKKIAKILSIRQPLPDERKEKFKA